MHKNKQYISKARKVLVKHKGIDYAFMFGSGTKVLLPGSDIDILIGGQLDFSERTDLALELEIILGRKVDIVLSKEALPELILKAFSSGSPIVVNSKESLKKDYFKNRHFYEDRANLRRLRISRIKRRYNHG